ncbi:MAG: aminomethyl-transferring glycine dehydrogenase subunit GcvPA [Acidobacteriota bacterium]
MKYLSSGPGDRHAMLEEIGVSSIDDLFSSIPRELRHEGPLPVSPALSDPDLEHLLRGWASENLTLESAASFLGAGAYRHYRSPAVDAILTRSEFYTSYTPYQPEISQGTLQSLFEYQTFICMLTEMEVSNASLYDGGSALAEAMLMAHRLRRGACSYVSESVHPNHRQVAATYAQNAGIELRALPRRADGATDPEAVEKSARSGASSIIVQSPNFFGVIEPLEELAAAAHLGGAMLLVSVVEPVSLGLLRGPGHFGADIVTGEGQAFGLPPSFGGPYLGFLACMESAVRALPGRLVGETVDVEGERGYVLTLATREQHIRREKATSNICTNQGLCALALSVQLAALGRHGLPRLARLNAWNARQALARISDIPGIQREFKGPFFNEFVVELPDDAGRVCQALAAEKVLAGVPLGRWWPELNRHLLICATELTRPEEIDRLAQSLHKATVGGDGTGQVEARSERGAI